MMSNVTFREIRADDVSLVFANREFAVSNMNGGVTRAEYDAWTLEDEKTYTNELLQSVAKGEKAVFVISDESGEYVGKCMLHHVDTEKKSASLSVSIREKYWGKGIGTEAVRFLENLAFGEMGLRRLEYVFYSFNERSQKLAEKLGYLFEKRLPNAKKIGDQYFDRIVYGKVG